MRRAVRSPVLEDSDRSHELVGVQAALHQKLAFARLDKLDSLCRRRLAVWCINDFISADIDSMVARRLGNLCGRPDENRLDDAKLRCLDRATE